jgi:hypothetical protein
MYEEVIRVAPIAMITAAAERVREKLDATTVEPG